MKKPQLLCYCDVCYCDGLSGLHLYTQGGNVQGGNVQEGNVQEGNVQEGNVQEGNVQEIRFGVLGAARIVPWGLLRPAQRVPGVRVVAIGARDQSRAAAMAHRYAIDRPHAGYEAVLADPEVTAVYVPLPNGLHAAWAERALQAGKHVLCEKPIASNAEEAARLADVARQSGRVCMEAFHWRYHPLALRLLELVRDPAAGPVQKIVGRFRTPMLRRRDIRFEYELGGGATMDLGCYLINMVRVVSGAEPVVEWARARLLRPDVDRRMEAALRLPGGGEVRIDCEMGAWRFPQIDFTVQCARRTVKVVNPILPSIYHRLVVSETDSRPRASEKGKRSEQFTRRPTYEFQLELFADAVRNGRTVPSDAADGVRNMAVIDQLYTAAGLPRRGLQAPAAAPAAGHWARNRAK